MWRVIVLAAATALALLAGAGTAAAHVTTQPSTATKGTAAEIAFRVPDEEKSASTTEVQVSLPADHPIASVRPRAMAGWTADATTTRTATPLSSDDGPVTEVVSVITWHGGSIAPGSYDAFVVLLDPVPSDEDSLVFKVIQTYDNGDVVRWIDTGAGTEHPAPVVTLVAAERAAAVPDLFGVTGTVLGVVAGAMAALAWRRNRQAR
ncbi:YcnI family protein [Kutzneria sp. 744]|uniref:YcnI family protein n=1 Tax=Kutzneria sp. (strain 744) TaxID=345341 RepID=UPI0004B1E800|nr:YcnI family protein [Kutzneria sp. 744]